MIIYSIDIQEYNNTANCIKSVLLRAIEKEGFITEQQLESIDEKYAVLIRPKGFFGSIWDKIFSDDEKQKTNLAIEVIKRV